jgi:DNA-binding NtrC family response regulator
MKGHLPRLLIVDDLFGRRVQGQRNDERSNLCGQFLLEDVTGDERDYGGGQRIRTPVAEAVFYRGQQPASSAIGDTVENDLEGTLQFVKRGWEATDNRRWSMVLLDLSFYTGLVTPESNSRAKGMPEGRPDDDDPSQYFGLSLLRSIRDRFPELPIVILSSKHREEVSRDLSSGGALAFLPRGEANSRELLKEYISRHALLEDDEGLIAGSSVGLLVSLRTARRSADGRRHVLLRGERGTGKELLARYIHRQGTKTGREPYVTVDSGTLNSNLFASELFGHIRGAFTSADRDRRGRIIEANSGDLFLDEIGNMPPDVQAGLLRVLESREVTPVGSSTGQQVDVRFISATNDDIESRSYGDGKFRADLLDRLREGGTIFLPPLRERREDIAELSLRFTREAEGVFGALRRDIDSDTLAMLSDYDWPGNVRELRNTIFDAVSAHRDIEHLSARHITLLKEPSSDRAAAARPAAAPEVPGRALDLGSLLTTIDEFQLDSLRPADLVGGLKRIEGAYAALLARYLRTALQLHVKHSPDAPEGKLQIHPALVMMTGESGLSATKAYDLIIKLRHIAAAADPFWESDPLLREAYERAIAKRRPLRGRRSTD